MEDALNRKKMKITLGVLCVCAVGLAAVIQDEALPPAQPAREAVPAPAAVIAPATAHVEASHTVKPKAATAEKMITVDQSIDDEPLVRQATSVSSMSGGSGDGVATLLNLNGELCAATLSATPMKKPHHYSVICTTNRDGSGYSRYSFDAKSGHAELIRRT